MKIIAIEEHWNSAAIRDALDRLPNGARDESIAFNTMGDNQARLEDIGQGRLIPTLSVDQYAATLASWFGVSNSDLATVVPNIGNYAGSALGTNVGFV